MKLPRVPSARRFPRLPAAPRKELPPLWAHQERAEEYAYSRERIGLLMRMRLGKTRVAVRWVRHRHRTALIHVLLPGVAKEAWTTWLEAYGEHYVIAGGMPRARRVEALRTCKRLSAHRRVWVLLNYECLDVTPEISSYPPDVAIADESTYIANPRSRTTKAANRLYAFVPEKGISTGTIRPESDMDVFCQMKWVQGSFMGCTNFYTWRLRWFQPDPASYGGHGWIPKPGARARIREAVEEFAFHCSHADAGITIPRVYETRMVPMNTEQARLQKQILKEFAATLADGSRMETNWVVVRELWLRRLAGGLSPDGTQLISTAKCEDLLSLIRGEMSGERLVAFFSYREELAQALTYLTERSVACKVLWGGLTDEQEAATMDDFRSGRAPVLLATVEKAQFSLDCSVASAEYYYSNVWSTLARSQSEERIMHVERQDPVLVIDAVTEGSVDEDLVPRLRDKTFDAQNFLVDFARRWSR